MAKMLRPQDITLAHEGLEGINETLDESRKGTVSAKRVIVLFGNTLSKIKFISLNTRNTTAQDKLNGEPSCIKFA